MKHLRFPEVRNLSELFADWGPWPSGAPNLAAIESNLYQKHNKRRGRDVLHIGAYCFVRGEHAFSVKRLAPGVLDRIKESMVIIDDTTYFEIIPQTDGKTALVTISHNCILGSHWLAMVQWPVTLP